MMLNKVLFLLCGFFGLFSGYLGHYVTRVEENYWATPTPYIGFLFGMMIYYSLMEYSKRKKNDDG